MYGQYKPHESNCVIISGFDTLYQDRYCYLLSQISNSLNVISNIKGLSERGAVGTCNCYNYIYLALNCANIKRERPDELENIIENNNYDQALQEYCRVFLQLEDQMAKRQMGEAGDKSAEQHSVRVDQSLTTCD